MNKFNKNIVKLSGMTLFMAIFPVSAYAIAPILSFTVSSQNITSGQSITVSWFADNIAYCTASGDWSIGIESSYGSRNLKPTETSTYVITCLGPYGSVSDTKTVFVNQSGGSSPTVIYTPSYTTTQNNNLIPIPTPPIPIPPPQNNFTAACAASPSATETNKVVSFAAAYTGGYAPVVYRWSGDITGSQQVENIAFEHAGVKTAKITVTDSRGLSAEGTCYATISEPAKTNTSTVSSVAPPPVPVKKPAVTVASATQPTCKTVTVCIDTAGNVTQKDQTKKDEQKIETAQNGNGNGNGTKKFFLASLFGSGNSNGNGSSGMGNYMIYLLPILAAACVIFIGYMIVRFSKSH